MGIFRILGLIGSASCIVLLIYVIAEKGLPDEPVDWWIAISLVLTVFNFFSAQFSDSLIGLWIEAKKSKLRKQIN
jgi:hypothetical protein